MKSDEFDQMTSLFENARKELEASKDIVRGLEDNNKNLVQDN